MFGFAFDDTKDSNEDNFKEPDPQSKVGGTEENIEKKAAAKSKFKPSKRKDKYKHQTEKIETPKANVFVRKETKKLHDDSHRRVKREMVKMIEQLNNLEEGEKNRFKEILDMLSSFGLKWEITLSRILAWNYFSELERIKEKHKTEKFILNKQIEGLKDKLIDISSRRFKEFQGVSITIDNSGEDWDSDFNYK